MTSRQVLEACYNLLVFLQRLVGIVAYTIDTGWRVDGDTRCCSVGW